MQTPPHGVPEHAVYSQDDGWWQLGELRAGKPFGAWKTFRRDGSPLFEARFDSQGRMVGSYRRFHPDGSIAREATYDAGTPSGEHTYHRGPGDVFPCGDRRATRLLITYDDDGDEVSRVRLDARGRGSSATKRMQNPARRSGPSTPCSRRLRRMSS